MRDRAMGRLRVLSWGVAVGSAGLAAGLSAVAAHAFKGHGATSAAAPATTPTRRPPARGVHVPGPQHVPGIVGQPAPLQPPAAAPSTPAQQQQQPAPAPAPPPVSGGS